MRKILVWISNQNIVFSYVRSCYEVLIGLITRTYYRSRFHAWMMRDKWDQAKAELSTSLSSRKPKDKSPPENWVPKVISGKIGKG